MIKFINIKSFLTGIFTLLLFVPSFGEEKTETAKSDPQIELIYQKNNDNSWTLTCNLGISADREVKPVKNAVINFYTGQNFEISLGSAVTNKKGKAVCNIPAKFKLPVNAEGKFSFKADFTGNDTLNNGETEIQVKDLVMEMVFEEHDSTRNITVKAYEKRPDGKVVPLINEAINVYIPRMFSLLKIAELKLDSSGTASLDFPSDIPSDSNGMLKIMARLEEHADYGNVEKFGIKKWGKPVSPKYIIHRALWTAVAPWWMIISLTIMLIGVWAHYLYVILRLIMVSRSGKTPTDFKYY